MFRSWWVYATIAAIFTLCALVIAGCWDSGSDEMTRSNAMAQTGETAPSSRVAYSNDAVPEGEATPSKPSEHGDYLIRTESRVPAPLRLRIFEASAIVRASLITSSVEAVRYSAVSGIDVDESRLGVGDTYPVDGEYRAVQTFRFNVHEYLKGSGGSEITATARTFGTHGTEAQATEVARGSLAERDTSRDVHEAILFLWEPASNDAFQFLRSGPYPSLHYTIDTLNRVWLPSQNPLAYGGGSSSPDDSSHLYLTEETLGAAPPTISLAKLRSEIAAVDALIAAGDGTDEYRDCVVEIWRYEHRWNGYLRGKPRDPQEVEFQLRSGMPEGTVIHTTSLAEPKYSKILIDGADKTLFRAVQIDDDDRPDNGYKMGDSTARPLPAGTYGYESYSQDYIHVPCNFFPYNTYVLFKVVVTAPTGTLYEAFFDPVTVGEAIGADASDGVLKPASFTDANSASATIHGIAWEAGSVKLKVSPHTGLEGHKLDFIELDGAASLSLQVNDATVDAANGTLSWEVSEQPWKDGDLLMVRIRESRQ